MKSREYYEQLLSRQIDDPLTELEQQELEQAMEKDPTLREFDKLLQQHAELLQTLPDPAAPSA